MTDGPRHQPQLGRGIVVPGRTQGSRDCGPRTVQMGLHHTTGKVYSITAVRKAMGAPGPALTNVTHAQRAAQHYGVPYHRKRRVVDVRRAVASGRFVHLCLDYGVLNDRLPATGDPAFRGGHSVGVLGQRKRDGVVEWRLYDPLDDSRRKGIPQGPRWVPRAALLAALVAFGGGKDSVYAGIFGRPER